MGDNNYYDWEPIDPFKKTVMEQLPDFPVEAMPEVLRDYGLRVTESIQVTPEMVFPALLSLLALCHTGTMYIHLKQDWDEPLNIYEVVVADPSERKSPVLKELEAPVYDFIAEENERRKPEIRKYFTTKKMLEKQKETLMNKITNGGEGSITQVEDIDKQLEELEEVNEINLIADDVTPEVLGVIMKKNCERMGIISAEGGVFGMLSGRYTKAPNIDLFLKGFSGEPYSSSRIGRDGEKLTNPLLTMLLMVQPVVLKTAMQNNTFRERGLLARFLYVLPKSKVGSRIFNSRPIDPNTRQAYKDIIQTQLSFPRRTQGEENTIKLSPGAQTVFENFCNGIEVRLTDDLEPIADWAGKLCGVVGRIAGNIHCVECGGFEPAKFPLSAETMQNAIRIGEFFMEHAFAAFEGTKESKIDKDAKYILSKAREGVNDWTDWEEDCNNNVYRITSRNLQRHCRRFAKRPDDIRPALDELAQRHYITVKKQPSKGGRPTEIVTFNPMFWTMEEK